MAYKKLLPHHHHHHLALLILSLLFCKLQVARPVPPVEL
jgi:hypothetical protein